MPLAFPSRSHGEIAFGFFNIDTDMLLLEQYFLFADQFCKSVAKMARAEDLSACRDSWDIHAIQPPEQVGDLMGAIHGIRYTGFIGAVYRLFPFPVNPEDFRQKPDGCRNRERIAALIADFAVRRRITVAVDTAAAEVRIGDYRFAFPVFQELIRYVWRGGYPRWRDAKRPACVQKLFAAAVGSPLRLFNTIDLQV